MRSSSYFQGSQGSFLAIACSSLLLLGCIKSPSPDTLEPSKEPSVPLSQSQEERVESELKIKVPLRAEKPQGLPTLQEYYRSIKYTDRELRSVRDTVEQFFVDYTPEQRKQLREELLSFHYVVFHKTKWHRLDQNHAVLRKHEPLLRDLCKRYEVPLWPVMAITSWENSGFEQKISWADAAGLGQMTWGAVKTAHDRARQEQIRLTKEGKELLAMGKQKEGRELLERAKEFDFATRHKKIAKEKKIQDERLIPQCNLEDVVFFFKYLLEQYDGQVDHAIGAYHRGVQNTDDILLHYFEKIGQPVQGYSLQHREPLLEALRKKRVTYLDLWNHSVVRDMLNGLRTVTGELTDSSNGHMALGDESDIYLYKVLASLAAYREGEAYVREQMGYYDPPQALAELRDLASFNSYARIEKARTEKRLVPVSVELIDKGISEGAPADSSAYTYSYYVTPELNHYLKRLLGRYRKATGDNSFRLPIRHLLGCYKIDRPEKTFKGLQPAHHQGVAATLSLASLEPGQKKLLLYLIKRDYLYDRIYQDFGEKDEITVILNPRFGQL